MDSAARVCGLVAKKLEAQAQAHRVHTLNLSHVLTDWLVSAMNRC